jgi:hypothetical protein
MSLRMILLFILILLCSLCLQFFLPWWIIAPVAAALSFWKAANSRHAFFSAFLALFVLWVGMSLVKTVPNHNILLDRVAGLFGMPAMGWSRVVIVIAAGLIGGLTAGMAALAAYLWKSAFIKK